MDAKKLVTLAFDKNVGAADRVIRMLAGGALAGAGWVLGLPLAASVGLSVVGAMVFATGATSKCSVYYLLGYSTCPVSGQPFEGRA